MNEVRHPPDTELYGTDSITLPVFAAIDLRNWAALQRKLSREGSESADGRERGKEMLKVVTRRVKKEKQEKVKY